MWIRTPTANNIATVTVTGNVYVQGDVEVRSSRDPGVYFMVEAPSTRTTFGLQVQPRFGNSWFTPTTGAEQLTFAEFAGGFVHVSGLVSQVTPGNRNDGIYCFDLNATTFATRFKVQQEVHMLADGRDRANNNQPVFVIGTDGNVLCYNLDNITAGQLDYRINCVYNKFTVPGKYENTGGGPT